MGLRGLTKADIEEAKASIWACLKEGKEDDEIMDLLGIDPAIYWGLRHQAIEDQATKLKAMPSEHVYIQYLLDQHQNIRELTNMLADLKSTKQHNAMVGAIKARADLYDRLIAKGQEFGVFKKAAETKRIIAGVVVTELSKDDLKKAITKAILDLDQMMGSYGDVDITEMEAGSLHYGPALPAAPVADAEAKPIVAPRGRDLKKTARAKTSKTSKARGRKPFKESTK